VREQFRIADGERLHLTEDPEPRGHAFEFRINGEDPGRNFLPAPGMVTATSSPPGRAVRVDSGIEANSVIGGAFDSLLAKLIVRGADRAEALARSRRASVRWSWTGWPPRCRSTGPSSPTPLSPPRATSRSRSTPVGSRRSSTTASSRPRRHWCRRRGRTTGDRRRRSWRQALEVSLPAGFGGGDGGPSRKAAPKRRKGGHSASASSGDTLAAPMQGTIVKVAVADGDTVAAGDLIVVLEAMKMGATHHRAQVGHSHRSRRGGGRGGELGFGDLRAEGLGAC
jgi:acetyl-CoA/propionyl-CoA carboxylase biotin carboxyl carrier protein